jgi:hypothetical protein
MFLLLLLLLLFLLLILFISYYYFRCFSNTNNYIYGSSQTGECTVDNLFSDAPYQLSINTYVNVYIENLPISTTNASGLNSTFKIPLSYANQVLNVSNIIGNQTLNTYFFDEQNCFQQVIEITDSNYVMDKLKISVYDRTGNILTAIPLDWSFTLEIAFDT